MKNAIVSASALLPSLNICHPAYADALSRAPMPNAAGVTESNRITRFAGEPFARTELFFGTARPVGFPPVTEAEFQDFLDTRIIRRSPAA